MTDRAELSSLSGLIEQVTGRITALAEGARERHDDDVAKELFAMERALHGVLRRLERMLLRNVPRS